jgi:hypothetical protein
LTLPTAPRDRRRIAYAAAVASLALACGAAGAGEAEWPPLAKKWYERAEHSYRSGDIEDAEHAVGNALRIVPKRDEVRLLAARIALAELEYDRVLQLLQGLESTVASTIRGRALWYAGRIDQAADELERLTTDPEVRDAWAVEVAKLARRGGGRKPFQLSGGLLAVSEMPQVSSTALVVPLEVNGEPALGMIATGTAEAVVDASSGGEPSWISLRFGERIEVKDVPALAKDLSGISRTVNAPIKMLLGVNLLRHLHPTFDFTGGQFVVRTFEPPPPPQATTLRVAYVRGGGMLLRGAFGVEQSAPEVSLMVDTSMSLPVALDDGGWKKAGISTRSLRPVPSAASLRQGVLPILRLGAFEVPQVPAFLGAPVTEIEKGLEIELDGLVGSGLLAAFRVTLVDGGRTMWLEDVPTEAVAPKKSLEPPAVDINDLPDEEEPAEEEPAKPPAKAPAKQPKKPAAPAKPK